MCHFPRAQKNQILQNYFDFFSSENLKDILLIRSRAAAGGNSTICASVTELKNDTFTNKNCLLKSFKILGLQVLEIYPLSNCLAAIGNSTMCASVTELQKLQTIFQKVQKYSAEKYTNHILAIREAIN